MSHNPFAYAGIGSRKTPLPVLVAMRAIGKDLAERGWLLRSGGALGADSAFEEGCDVASGSKEIFLPWIQFNGHTSVLHNPSLEAYRMAKEFHPAWDKLTTGAQKLMARNSHQVFGPDLNNPVKMLICWTPNGSGEGGTGQAIRIAREFDIPVIDLGAMSIPQAWERIHGRLSELAA
jgi:hypothetical protein